MSKQQWGHGYYTGYKDGRSDALNGKYYFADEVMYWYISMCISNRYKTYKRQLFPVSEFISMVFCKTTMTMTKCITYAKKIYDWVMHNSSYYQIEYEGKLFVFFITGNSWEDWTKDIFVILTPTEDQFDWYHEKRNLLENKLRFSK